MMRSTAAWLALLALAMPAAGCAGNRARTPHPSGPTPDALVVTLPDDPRTSFAVSWRVSPGAPGGALEVRGPGGTPLPAPGATCEMLDSADWVKVPNDPVVRRCSAKVTGLAPDTAYEYRVAAGAASTAWHAVRTAPPGRDVPVTFLDLGDAQVGLEAWSRDYQAVIDRHPEVRFTTSSGDMVNDGAARAEYDALFGGAADAFARIPWLPALGNHEHRHRGADLWTRQYVLPEDGPGPAEHVYAVEYGPLLVAILDSSDGERLAEQARWLDRRLAASDAPWKVAVFHHPIWSAAPVRDNKDVRAAFQPVFEARGVRLVLTGHDHSYARTPPLRDGRPADDGIVYLVTVSGYKLYGAWDSPRFARTLAETRTYQLISASADRLVMSTRQFDGTEVDRVELRR